MANGSVGYQVHYVDFTGFVEGRTRQISRKGQAKRPQIHTATFPTQEQAEARKAELRAMHGDGFVCCITALRLGRG